MGPRYDFASLENKWQAYWEKHKSFRCRHDSSRPKYYILDMFPYPSGAGLHVGHCLGYTATDIVARYKRMRGFHVLHPMGWDSFGLPAENYAIKTGTHPAQTTAENIQAFRAQLKALGFSYDWDREVATSDPSYYRWTQWLFIRLYNKGLVYETEANVNWCEALGCVLANEEVVDGLSEVGGHPVVKRPMVQWALKITDYADRLLEDLEDLDWPENIKELQRNWIGRSLGASITFSLQGHGASLTVFTTRADTLFGATYMVLAPEHPLTDTLTTEEHRQAVAQYRDRAQRKSDLERTDLNREKTGVFTGAMALNPATGQPIPLWVADYVLASYGTGAVMGVPAHDQRDWEFAKKFHLPILPVVEGGNLEREAYLGDGPHINSPPVNGLDNRRAQEAMISWLEENNLGGPRVNYKLRDWIFSRQRYWGEPFPILKDADTGEVVRLLNLEELPLELPPLEDFTPQGRGESPLAKLDKWHTFVDPASGRRVRRETHTMPQWAGSCWYYLRFIDPHNTRAPWDGELESHWMPVDLYVGGVEHAVLHLLYARFWHKVFYDLGLVSTAEPFKKLVNQGLILGEDGEKMSKSRGNVVNPGEAIDRYGADALRLYEMFMGPLEKVKPWQTGGIKGVFTFLERAHALLHNVRDGEGQLARPLHKCIKKVTEDLESLRFNTACSAMMVFLGQARRAQGPTPSEASAFVRLLAPFAPHLAEELWESLGHGESVSRAPWPTYDPSLAREETVTMAVQVNGKTRATLCVPADMSREDFLAQALEDKKIAKWTAGKTIHRDIFVPGKILNLIVS